MLSFPWSFVYVLLSATLELGLDVLLGVVGASVMLRGRGQWVGRLGGAALWWAITSALGHLTSTVAGFFGYGRMATLEVFGPWTFYARELVVQVWDTATVAVAVLLVARGLRAALAGEAPPEPRS